MRKFLFASLLFAMACTKKDAVVAPSLSSQSSSNITVSTTKFGVLPYGVNTIDNKIKAATSLGVSCVRYGLSIADWRGKSYDVEKYQTAGFKILMNIMNQNTIVGQPIPFPTDMVSYRQTVDAMTTKYKYEMVVVENEELNATIHIVDIPRYIKMIQTAVDVCHSKGIPVTNGGLYGQALEVLTYRWYVTVNPNAANTWANSFMGDHELKAAKAKPGERGYDATLEAGIVDMKTLINAYDILDYINIHPYETLNRKLTTSSQQGAQTTSIVYNVLNPIQQYLTAMTGRPVITNETGIRNNKQTALVTSLVNQYLQLNW